MAAHDPCVADLDAAAELLAQDYPGYVRAEADPAARIDVTLADTREIARGLKDAACDAAIRDYLDVFADGHLLLTSRYSPPVEMPTPLFADDRRPVARPLSERAFLIRVPSFAVGLGPAIDTIVVEHEEALRAHEILIVDLRGNGGGSDTTWTDLVKPIYTDPMERWGVRWYPTEGNARAIEEQVEQMRTDPRSASMCDAMQQIADGMREHLGEGPVSLGASPGRTVTLPNVWDTPRRVGIVADRTCASACENFLLAARQSTKVTVFGSATYGVTDFQNIRAAELPSGDRQLRFAMSISERVLETGDRRRGIVPDEELPSELLRDADGAIEAVLDRMRAGNRSPLYPTTAPDQRK
jgi:hypothetical protein